MGDVEQAMTWAEQVAALLVENAAAHVRIAELEDANAKILQTAVDRIGELEARIMTLQSFPAPAVSHQEFPFNAIRHSRLTPRSSRRFRHLQQRSKQ